MSYFSKLGRDLAVSAFEHILDTFSRLNNIHGFIYFIMIFGEYVQLLYSIEKDFDQIPKQYRDENKVLYSDSKILRDVTGILYRVIGPCTRLRNGFAHWGFSQIETNFKALRAAIQSININTVTNPKVRNYIIVLKSVDYAYMRSELLRISPELNL